MNIPPHTTNLIAALVVLFAASIFAGVLLWQGARPTQHLVSVPPPAPRSQLTDVLGADSPVPHYPGGVVLGRITAVGANTITVDVIPPGASEVPADAVSATIVVDTATELYRPGATKPSAEYNKEIAAYVASQAYDKVSPDPYMHEPLNLPSFVVSMTVSILPKTASNTTTILAKSIMPVSLSGSGQ